MGLLDVLTRIPPAEDVETVIVILMGAGMCMVATKFFVIHHFEPDLAASISAWVFTVMAAFALTLGVLHLAY